MNRPGGLGARVAALLGRDVGDPVPLGGGSVCTAARLGGPAGREAVFAKTLDGAPDGFFAAEAAGLRLLAATGTVAVPEVWAADRHTLVLEWIEPGPATPSQAERLGRELAALHGVRAASWGTAGPGFIGRLPLPSPAGTPPAAPEQWPAFHAEYRLLPFLRQAADGGSMARADVRAVERVCALLPRIAGPPEPPALIHGDLWSGNVLFAADGRARLVDPAAQGGRPEADLAMLELFGCPQLPRILAAYEEVRPVPGRRERVPLHQLHPLLVHAALFGGRYGAAAGNAAREALSRA
ncbi:MULTISPECIES: fructosamine kinase family protein [unclassified Streptomyces]|uniref:fructosamine kinase family protein n=1 Tax=unclassified Streptomyces TaxID=2593676 RepID=UPI00381D0DBE